MATAGDAPGAGPERAFARPLPERGRLALDAEESAHLVRVRRAREGDAVVLFDGEGGTRLGRLVVASPRAAEVEVEGPYPDREPGVRVTVAVSPPEGGRADDLVAALAEIGVFAFVPIRCERTPPGRIESAARRANRWERLVREAAKVSGRSRFLALRPAADLAAVLAGTGATESSEATAAMRVLLDPDPRASSLATLRTGRRDPVLLVVGPEGGFSPREREEADSRGLIRARVVKAALRVESAAVAAAAVALAAAENGFAG